MGRFDARFCSDCVQLVDRLVTLILWAGVPTSPQASVGPRLGGYEQGAAGELGSSHNVKLNCFED
eukprot:3038915-Amphidinium_carterae.1